MLSAKFGKEVWARCAFALLGAPFALLGTHPGTPPLIHESAALAATLATTVSATAWIDRHRLRLPIRLRHTAAQ